MSISLMALFSLALLAPTLAEAGDDRLDAMKSANREVCQRVGTHPKDAPKRAELLAPYCDCVTDAYWDSVPAASLRQLKEQGDSPDIREHYETRMAAAKATCKAKLGF